LLVVAVEAVKLIGLPVRPVELAVTTVVPEAAPNVRVVDAWPDELVATCIVDKVPPPDAMANVTCTPDTGVPLPFNTVTTNGLESACPIVPDWLFPLVITILVGWLLVVAVEAVKLIGLPERPAELAVTIVAPEVAPNVRVVNAWPDELVAICVVDKVPTPDAMVNVTCTPATGFPLTSVTATTNGAPSGCPTVPV